MDIISLAKNIFNDNVISDVSKSIGAEKPQTQEATSDILELLLAGLAKNTKTQEGAEALNKALEKDHDGSLLDQLLPYLQGQEVQTASEKTTNGEGILDHILGAKKDQSTEVIAKKTGLSASQVTELLVKYAPVALDLLGKYKKDTGAGSTDIADTLSKALTKTKSENNSSGWLSVVEKFLDKDGDGSVTDDIIDWLSKKMKS